MQAAAVDAPLAVADGLSVVDTEAVQSVADTAAEFVVATTAGIAAAMDMVMAAASGMGTV
jgi:hypothetical protein